MKRRSTLLLGLVFNGLTQLTAHGQQDLAGTWKATDRNMALVLKGAPAIGYEATAMPGAGEKEKPELKHVYWNKAEGRYETDLRPPDQKDFIKATIEVDDANNIRLVVRKLFLRKSISFVRQK